MESQILQIWGACCYLSNKIFFFMMEKSHSVEMKRKHRITAWLIYLIGLPAWIIIFAIKGNWIAAAVELGAAPAMIYGVYVAMVGHDHKPRFLSYTSNLSVAIGLGLSLYHFGGVLRLTQFLELGIAAGFLLGTHRSSRQYASGYLWFIVGNISCASLMAIEGYYIMMTQQLISLIFVCYAYVLQRRVLKPDLKPIST